MTLWLVPSVTAGLSQPTGFDGLGLSRIGPLRWRNVQIGARRRGQSVVRFDERIGRRFGRCGRAPPHQFVSPGQRRRVGRVLSLPVRRHQQTRVDHEPRKANHDRRQDGEHDKRHPPPPARRPPGNRAVRRLSSALVHSHVRNSRQWTIGIVDFPVSVQVKLKT
jgi:hypothetical protein